MTLKPAKEPMKTKKPIEVMTALVAVCVFALMSLSANAAFIPLGRTNYFQNFDSLVSQGKSKSLPLGWAISSQDGYIYADNGNSTAAGIYSYGNTGSGNRALGVLNSGSSHDIFGAAFQNTGSASINSLHISFTGEEWRLGSPGERETLQFQYSLNAGSLTSGTWLNAPALNFSAPNLTGVGAHDGTLAVNQQQLAGTLSFLNIPVGATFWVRWEDGPTVSTAPQDGLAIDNFSISAVPEVSTFFAALAATGFLGVVLWKKGSRCLSLA
jgi:hypothetical protein